MGSAQRMLMITVAMLVLAGVGLTGWNEAHWFLYVVSGLLTFAGVSGFCITYSLYQKLGLK